MFEKVSQDFRPIFGSRITASRHAEQNGTVNNAFARRFKGIF